MKQRLLTRTCNYSEPSEFIENVRRMLAFRSIFSYKFIWREATTRKSEGFSSLALNSYNIGVNKHERITIKIWL